MALIDLVKWEPGNQQIFAWKFHQSNLSTMTQLIVSESQEAILFTKGQLIGKFGPGKHTLNTENLPLLRNLFGIGFGGNNPFTAEVWFVNKLVPLTIDWSTDAMMYHDPDYQTMVPIVAMGRYGLRVDDAERFLIKLVGTAAAFGATELTNHFWGALVAKTKSVLLGYMQTQRIGIKSISAYLEPLSEGLKASMLAFWEDYGFTLTGFYITSIDIDGRSESGRRILDAMSRQSAQVIGGYTWQQAQTFEAADKAITSMGQGNGGLLGAVMMTNMMGGAGGMGGALLQPTQMSGVGSASGQGGPGNQGGAGMAPLPPREVFCSNCAKKFSSLMKFCPHCGDPYTPCPRCGTDNDTKACRWVSCGTPLAAEASCSVCGSAIPPGGMSCPKCTRPLGGAGACTRCGTRLSGSPAFCPQCGKKVE